MTANRQGRGAWIARVLASFRQPERESNMRSFLAEIARAQLIADRMLAEATQPTQAVPEVYTGPLRRARRDHR